MNGSTKHAPPMSGTALRAVVAAAEAPVTGAIVFATMIKQMGIDALMRIPDDEEPLPLDQRALVVESRTSTTERSE